MARSLSLNLYEYLDYRAFLRDAYQELKQRQPGFSYRWFAQHAGMTSPNFLKLVIEGKRNLTAKSGDQFAKAFGLSTREAGFFRDLVAFNQATTPADKNRLYKAVGKHRKHRAVRRLERATFEYLSRWYYPAIRELVACEGFREDPDWIGQALCPKISATQASKALEVLLAVGVLQRDAAGKLVQGEPLLSTGPEVRSLAVGNFHRQMMERAAASIETVNSKDREISGVTLPLSRKGFEVFKQRIHELRAEILELSAEEKCATRVVQFNFQVFPLAINEEC